VTFRVLYQSEEINLVILKMDIFFKTTHDGFFVNPPISMGNGP